MGFDKNDDTPLIQPRRWGTRVNFAMAAGVIVFLVLGVLAIFWMRSHYGRDADAADRQLQDKR